MAQNFTQFIRQILLTLIKQGLFAFVLPVVSVGVPNGVVYSQGSDDEEAAEEQEDTGTCAACRQYECEC